MFPRLPKDNDFGCDQKNGGCNIPIGTVRVFVAFVYVGLTFASFGRRIVSITLQEFSKTGFKKLFISALR